MTVIKVSKVDAAGGEELEGAKIQIIDSEGNVVDEWVSGKEAHETKGLKTGEEYTLKETVAPDGYTITTDTKFTIDETGKVTSTGTISEEGVLLVEDDMTVIKVSKVDIADGEELEGAKIQIIDSEGNVVDEWVSGKEAHETKGLKTGEEYTLRETVAPEGYTVTTDTKFTINEEGKVTSTGTITEEGVLLVEDSKTKIKVSKVDIASGEELDNAHIQIIDKDGNVVEEWDSKKGEAHEIEGLKTGEEYTLRETVAPEGYTVTTDTTFTIDETGKVTTTGSVTEDGVLLVEDAKTEIRVSKTDIATGEELEGATIQILDKDGNVVESWTSTKEAHVTTGLKTGETYTLRETVAPDGYAITSDTTFSLDETGKVTYSGTTTTDSKGNTVMLVEDAMTTIHVSKVDLGNGEELEGATIQIIDKDGNVVEEWTSTKEAHEVTGLKTGETYTLRETVAPEGYSVTTDTTFVLDEYGNVDTSKTTTTTKEGVLLVEDAKTEIRVSKTDIATGEELEGATIQILDKDGNVVEEWVSTKEAHVTTGLKTGEQYTLRETVAPEGYDVTTDTTFTIDETGKVTYSGTTTTDKDGNTVMLVEDARKGLKVSKVDIGNGEELEGAHIQIIDKDGNIVDEWDSTTTAHTVTGVKNGETYTLRETTAPDGYTVTADTTFTIDESGKVTYSGTTTTDKDGNTVLLVEDVKTEIRVSKTDIDAGEELEGAHIQILDKDGNVVDEWDSTKEAHVVTGLKTGETYTLKETVAPEGYTITSDTTFTIDETGKVTYSGTTTTDESGNTVMLVEDAKTEIRVSKTDVDSGDELEGAHIQILDEDGNVVAEWDSTKEVYVVTGLKTGVKYTLKETVAPEGYELTSETTFTIDETGKVTYSGTTTTDENGNLVLLVEDSKKSEKASLAVTKHLTTEEGEIFARDQVFYVQLFYDEECTEPATEIMALEFKNASAATVTFEGLEVGRTYYVKEVTSEGEPIEVGTVGGKTFVVEFENEDNTVIITTNANGTTRKEFNNEFIEIPDGFYRNGEIEVTKNVLTSAGASKNTNETFYVGFFDDKELTKLSEVVEYPILGLEMEGGSTTTNSTKIQVAPGQSYTIYVAEVDEDGNPVSKDAAFAYTVTTDKDSVTITEESLKASVTITNKEKGVTVTPTSAPTVTPGGSVRTGDDTNYEMYLALLGLAALMMAVVAVRRRREEEN